MRKFILAASLGLALTIGFTTVAPAGERVDGEKDVIANCWGRGGYGGRRGGGWNGGGGCWNDGGCWNGGGNAGYGPGNGGYCR